MDYFDSAYFDEAYFDTPSVTVTGGSAHRSAADISRDWVIQPESEPPVEDWLILIL